MKRDEVGRLTRQKDINAEVALYTSNVGEHPGRTLGSGRYQLTAETPDLYAEVVSGSNPSAVLLSGRLPVSDVPLSITPISALSSPDVSVPGLLGDALEIGGAKYLDLATTEGSLAPEGRFTGVVEFNKTLAFLTPSSGNGRRDALSVTNPADQTAVSRQLGNESIAYADGPTIPRTHVYPSKAQQLGAPGALGNEDLDVLASSVIGSAEGSWRRHQGVTTDVHVTGMPERSEGLLHESRHQRPWDTLPRWKATIAVPLRLEGDGLQITFPADDLIASGVLGSSGAVELQNSYTDKGPLRSFVRVDDDDPTQVSDAASSPVTYTAAAHICAEEWQAATPLEPPQQALANTKGVTFADLEANTSGALEISPDLRGSPTGSPSVAEPTTLQSVAFWTMQTFKVRGVIDLNGRPTPVVFAGSDAHSTTLDPAHGTPMSGAALQESQPAGAGGSQVPPALTPKAASVYHPADVSTATTTRKQRRPAAPLLPPASGDPVGETPTGGPPSPPPEETEADRAQPADFSTLIGSRASLTTIIENWDRLIADQALLASAPPPALLPMPQGMEQYADQVVYVARAQHPPGLSQAVTSTVRTGLGRLDIQDVVVEERYFLVPATLTQQSPTMPERRRSWTITWPPERLDALNQIPTVVVPDDALGAYSHRNGVDPRRVLVLDTGDEHAHSQFTPLLPHAGSEEPIDHRGHGTSVGSLARLVAPDAEVHSSRVYRPVDRQADAATVYWALSLALLEEWHVVAIPLTVRPGVMEGVYPEGLAAVLTRRAHHTIPLVVCAAGNDGPGQVMSGPAMLPGAMVAVASDWTGHRAPYNSRPPLGSRVYTTLAYGGVDGEPVCTRTGPDGRAVDCFGSSFATAIIAGALATHRNQG
jgi:hypothetical protein